MGLVLPVQAAHPVVLVADAERPAMLAKLRDVAWARTAYEKLRKRVDPYVERHKTDPEWITSRMLMNWDTHAITPIVEKDKWVRGEGRAPVPTPRYAGQRDWAGQYGLPGIDDLKPYNDKNGLIWARDRKGTYAWVHPSKTGHAIEGGSRSFLALAQDAAFIYWLTGDAAYARFAADIFWPYVYGFSLKRMPHGPNGKRVGEEGGPRHIYGSQTFEVIHDNIVKHIALTYDFLHGYLVAEGRDVSLVQEQLKRMADRVVAGGGREGNWNLHQADIIAHAALVLEEDGAYADGKGRQHYIDILLNADLPHQLGLRQVMRTGYDQATGIWPEAFGYGTGATVSITRIASLIARQQEEESVLDDPLMVKASVVQFQWLYPNGRSIGLGDTTHSHARTSPLEFLIAHARRNGQAERERLLTGALGGEVAAGRYVRGAKAGLVELCLYVPELVETAESGFAFERVFHGDPLNALILRNLTAEPKHSLMAALYGTRGGHTHANGLALELFGAGEILGPDPGPGSSYWQPDHGRYYKQRPAHNTVIVDGKSRGDSVAEIVAVEPAPGESGVSPNIGFADLQMVGGKPAASQRRCVALVRTSASTGFYLDIFRSRADSPEHQSHDYIYHNIGQSVELIGSAGQPLALSESSDLGSKHGDQQGYDYFKEERSGSADTTFRALFTARLGERTIVNSVWMLGAAERRVFALSAPKVIRATRGGLPKAVAGLPLPTVLVRQRREAWDEPFVAVFEPFEAEDGATMQSVTKLPGIRGSATGVVAKFSVPTAGGRETGRVIAVHDDQGVHSHAFPGGQFMGTFGVVSLRKNTVLELYLGKGHVVAHGSTALASANDQPVSASLRWDGACWQYSAVGSVRLRLPRAAKQPATKLWLESATGERQAVHEVMEAGPGAAATWSLLLPAGAGKLVGVPQ